ncbi:DUF748 domain-containing protein [Ulvibacterium sp.]|uniref:DUF748 domain-containing protein n=1 Tax=Ulvibacterium sp. TaxID=2665914 RepID=UPI00260D0D8A|nr:DUF748 domain-containing protein [Ulvibacterium sp.]
MTFIFKRKIRFIPAGILFVLIIMLMALPSIIKNYAINNSKELIGRQIDLGKLKYNYFTSTAKVYDFKMFEANDKETFLSFDTLIIDLEPLRLIFGEKNLEQFFVHGLRVNLVMQDSTFNFDDVTAFHSMPADSVLEEEEQEFKYDLSNLELKDANFYFDNRNVGKVTRIENFSFFIPQIVWDQTEKSEADLEFAFKNGGFFKSNLNINPSNGEFDADIQINGLNLKAFYEYVAQYAEVNDFDGVLNSTIRIHGNTHDATKSIVSGDVEVSDFKMADRSNKEFLRAHRITADLDKIDYANNIYEFGTIALAQPYVYFEMDSITNNYFEIFKLEEEPTADAGNPFPDAIKDTVASEELYYQIDKLKVNQGLMDYSDNLTGQRFDYHLNAITIDSDTIKSDARWINIYSEMLLNNRGNLKSKLGINPDDYNNLDLDIVIENFLLSDINIYVNYYTGHNILLGDFYYYSKSKITEGDIQSDNQLLVKNVTVENKKGGLYTLPLKFALFLLKDKNGDVNLTIPVRGNTNDPEVDIWKLVWTTLKNKITGAASNPITSLASLVDVDPSDYQELIFAYNDTVPSDENYQKLDKLLEMETAKEGLKVQLEHYVDTTLQMEAIAVEVLGRRYFKEKKKDFRKHKKAFERYVRRETKNDTMSVKTASLMLVPEKELSGLAQSYNLALRRNVDMYLKQKKPNTNIEVIAANPEESEHGGSQNRLLINFDMLTVIADDPIPNDSTVARK